MPRIVFLPHAERCPDGAVIEAESGENLIDVAMANGINIEHACEMSCACTTCHVIVRRALIRWKSLMRPRTTCWTRPRVLSPILG